MSILQETSHPTLSQPTICCSLDPLSPLKWPLSVFPLFWRRTHHTINTSQERNTCNFFSSCTGAFTSPNLLFQSPVHRPQKHHRSWHHLRIVSHNAVSHDIFFNNFLGSPDRVIRPSPCGAITTVGPRRGLGCLLPRHRPDAAGAPAALPGGARKLGPGHSRLPLDSGTPNLPSKPQIFLAMFTILFSRFKICSGLSFSILSPSVSLFKYYFGKGGRDMLYLFLFFFSGKKVSMSFSLSQHVPCLMSFFSTILFKPHIWNIDFLMAVTQHLKKSQFWSEKADIFFPDD